MRVVTLGLEPYADFSVLTPYGRRVAKALRHQSWVLQEDGSYKPLDVPGPDCFAVWEACYKVYEVILLMLRFPEGEGGGTELSKHFVVTPIALETYHEAFSTLVRQHPECWHLCQRAEDRCRAELFPRLARQLEEKLGRAASWSEVFIEAANDYRFWDKEVRHPAIGFLARGKQASSMTEMAEKTVVDAALAQGSGEPPKKKRRNGRGLPQLQPPPLPQGQPHQTLDAMWHQGQAQQKEQQAGEAHPRKDRKGRFTSTRDGTQICFKFTSGERDACSTAHVCQKCLQPHRTANCTKAV